MEKLRLFLVVSVFALLVAACGGDESSSSNVTPTQPVAISLSDLSATVEISATYQFSATVENAEDTTVDWQVNKVTGGEFTVGTISESGLYTAPDRVPQPVTVTVTAVAHADATKEASATVTIMSNVTVAVSPADTTLPAGETLQLTAAIENAVDTAAKWHVNDLPGGDATVGTISAGLYTAPSYPPPGGVVTITAISLADTSKTDSVNVTVEFSNASLNGAYVFSVSGHTLGVGPYYAAGRFVADGKGNIVTGTEDLTQINGASAQLSLTGNYEFQPGRPRGILNFLVEGFSTPATYRFSLTPTGGGPLLRSENSSTGSGQFYKQDADTFSNASLNGSYVFQFVGPAFPGTFAAAGIISYDGAGNITGFEDVNSDGKFLPQVPFTGAYSVDANGREVLTMTATVGTESQTSQVTAYLISSDGAVLTSIDSTGGAGLGMAEKQQLTSFSNGSFSGDFAFLSTSDPAVEPNFLAARLTTDGSGTLSAGVADVFADFANGGIWSQNVAFTGSYSIPATDKGRGTMSLVTPDGTEGAIFYLVSEKKAFLLGTSTNSPVAGQMVAQEGAPFSTSSLQGTFIYSLRGYSFMLEAGIVGSLWPDGNGALTARENVNVGGMLSGPGLTGTYSVGENGRGEVTMNDGVNEFLYTLYVVDSSHAFLVETDTTGRVLFGNIVKQY